MLPSKNVLQGMSEVFHAGNFFFLDGQFVIFKGLSLFH